MCKVLSWILVVHALHLPVPFPDLDGECRGTPIRSLSELHAWHILLVGVQPNDDIDHGPFHTEDEGDDSNSSGSLFGETAIVAPSSPAVSGIACTQRAAFGLTLRCGFANVLWPHLCRPVALVSHFHATVARIACISFCVWQV